MGWLLTGEQEEGQVTKYFYRSLYLSSQGMFCELPADLELGVIQVGSLILTYIRVIHANMRVLCTLWYLQVGSCWVTAFRAAPILICIPENSA